MTREDSGGQERQRLGVVVSGSLNKGIEVRLEGSASVEDMAVGRYVTIDGQKQRFFGMMTNVSLGVTDPMMTIAPPDAGDPFLSEVLSGTSAYGTLHILPMLTIGGASDSGPQAVKTIPSHFSSVYLASQADRERVFGSEDAR